MDLSDLISYQTAVTLSSGGREFADLESQRLVLDVKQRGMMSVLYTVECKRQ